MLHRTIEHFLDYSRIADFSIRPIQTLTTRLNEFEKFLQTEKIRSGKQVAYSHLIRFSADFNAPSIHVTKSRIWAIKHLYHFLSLHRIFPENITAGIPPSLRYGRERAFQKSKKPFKTIYVWGPKCSGSMFFLFVKYAGRTLLDLRHIYSFLYKC